MLPKFANHLFHHTARAAATVQNYAIRNVIGLQNPSSSSNGLGGWNGAGSSSWGGHGAGAGGAKYNTGSRFYGNSNGVTGRAVAQANSATAGDSNSGQNDENDDFSPKRLLRIANQRSRLRSSSLSSPSHRRHEVSEPAKQANLIQSRAQHTHANPTLLPRKSIEDTSNEHITDPTPSRSRRNSTSAASVPAFESVPPPFPQQTPQNLYELSYTNPVTPQTTRSPTPPPSESKADSTGSSLDLSETAKRLRDAVLSKDPKVVHAEIARFRLYKDKPTLSDFNVAIKALLRVREPGTPINVILETYNEMIAHGVLPNLSIYENLVVALCMREREVSQVMTQLQWNRRRTEHLGMPTLRASDTAQIQELRDERNLASAMTIFQAMAHLSPVKTLGNHVYNYLLRACSDNANVDAAIRVFGHLEASVDARPNAACYYHLLSTFVNAGDIKGAKDVFDEFRKAASEGRVEDSNSTAPPNSSFYHDPVIKEPYRSRSQTLLWNAMIRGYFVANQPDKAIELFEQMLNSTAGVNFSITDVPPLSPIIYTNIIRGFMLINDPQTAIAWFEKMLSQEAAAPEAPLDVLVAPMRPSQNTWDSFLEGLAEHNMVPELNKYAKKLALLKEKDGLEIRRTIRLLLLESNVNYLKTSGGFLGEEDIREIVEFLKATVLNFDGENSLDFSYENITILIEQALAALASYNYYDDALGLTSVYIKGVHQQMSQPNLIKDGSRVMSLARNVVVGVIPSMIFRQHSNLAPLNLEFALRFAEVLDGVGLSLATAQASAVYMHAYNMAKAEGHKLKLPSSHWSYLAYSAAAVAAPSQQSSERVVPDGFQFEGIPAFIQNLNEHGVKASDLTEKAAQRLVSALRATMSWEQAEEFIKGVGNDWVEVLNEVTRFSKTPSGQQSAGKRLQASANHPYPNHIDLYHGRYVDEYYRDARIPLSTAYTRYRTGVDKGTYPPPDVIGRLISRYGREGDREKVESLYQDAQLVLDALGEEKRLQSYGWFFVENHMIIARASLGDIDAAHSHRQAILANGGVPNADAYATLINNLKDNTDDNEHALRLWNEAQTHGVAPNLYLYNTMISQLSRARKAEMAIDLFREMKGRQIYPSSVTYGAVIAACSRVGDVKSAEVLFKEMTAQPNFKARVPPYNTMIQMFTNVKPDREKAIYYYTELLSAKIKPSAHTYKLLLDNYGTVQPVDITSMQRIFDNLVNDSNVEIQGTHWAALINAWGCVQKDLDKAIEIFDSIKDHPTSALAKVPLPDALVLEALVNVFVMHRRMDLARTYIVNATTHGVHMTAYIANLLIKGYASIDDMASAREIFERLSDPPAGIAAPYNHGDHGSHVPHKPYASSNGAFIFREPSTWEAMLRAELGSGNRDKALELLERLKSRQYPAAVYNRISSIMFGDGAMPWNSSDVTPSGSISQSSSPSFGVNSSNTSVESTPTSPHTEESVKP